MKKKPGQQEVEYKEKSGTAWSHSYLNQKPWHPLSYPNQRRKWIAEQQNAQKSRKAEEVAHEFAQQQEFFRQTAEMSKREKEKVENLQAVGFMYMRPPGYNAESARAAEIADERKMLGLDAPPPPPSSSQDATLVEGEAGGAEPEVKKKRRVKDVFGRNVATEEEFAVLKDAPKLDTGVAGRVKPFAVEIRNVKCAKCGGFGHQSGDRECPMKDVITPMEMERLKRNDPLNAIIAQATGDEPFKWELKNQPGAMSPARGGFRPDDPNQQILADEDIYDEYGGFLAGVGDGDASDEDGKLAMPDILASLTREQRKELAALRVDEKKWKKEDRKKNKRKKKKRKPHSDESTDKDTKRKKRSDESSYVDKQKKRKPRSDESSDEDTKRRKRKPRSDESSDEDKKKKRKPRSDESSDEEQHRHRHRSSHTKKHRKHQKRTSSETASEPSKKIENDSRHRHRDSTRSRDHDRERQVARDEALDEVYDSFKRQRRRDHGD